MTAKRGTRSRAWLGAVVVLAVAAFSAPLALADGDPASDILLASNVFYPYSPGVSKSLERTLNAETAAVAHDHWHIKVALIGGPTDLGLVPQLFDKPQTYAHFLAQELGYFLHHVLLLVVMPDGYGVEGLPAADNRVLASLAKPAGKPNDDLAQAAIVAVRKLASAAGHPIGKLSAGGGGAGGGTNTVPIVLVALAAVAIAGAILLTRWRLARGRRSGPHRRPAR